MSESGRETVAASVVRLRGRAPMLLMGLGHGATHWIAASFYALLPFITRDLGLSYAQAGMLVSVFHVASFAANFGSGLAVDISGRRVALQILSLLLGGAALMAFGLTGTYVQLVAAIAVIGATNNLWHPAAIAYLSSRYPKNRGFALSIHALGANLGDAVAPLAAGGLLVWMSWPGAAAVNALPVFAVAAALAVLLAGDHPGNGGAARGMDFREYFTGLARVVRDRAVLSLCLMAGLRTTAQNGLLVFLPLYIVDVLAFGPVAMGAVLMVMQLAGVITAPVAGALSDKIGRRPVVVAGLGVTTAVIAVLTLLGSGVIYVAGIALLGFALFAVRPVVHSWMMDLTPPALGGSATSLMFGTQAALSTAAPVLGGIVADRWGLPAVFYLLAALMLAANIVAALLPAKANMKA